ncbi:thioesterase family protein [Vampirovibrio chlorellavorus]|uniref:thioesterase family protein n=1 Tax=Vampirovibrio chlorellavorus TaxID=758823 RepID=UPI0026EAE0CA|nr:thioesterase family protein [Vampirovibrio chlorellavorus]
MRPGLQVGHHFEFSIQVTDAMRPQFGAQVIHPLYATASMLNHMEWAARQHVVPYLEPDEESVGYHIDLKHVAATPVGATVRVCSTVTRVKARKVISRVQAWHGARKVGEGLLTQALVRKEQLYVTSPLSDLKPIAASTSDTEQNSEAGPKFPPPAPLMDEDGQTGLQLELLQWETNQLPCSRYDEWLICRITVAENGTRTTFEGPFLLRHEIEDWLSASQPLASGESARFRSDFLEPILRVEMDRQPNGWCQCALRVQALDGTPSSAHPAPVHLTLSVSPENLTRFCQALIDQLAAFPSLL